MTKAKMKLIAVFLLAVALTFGLLAGNALSASANQGDENTVTFYANGNVIATATTDTDGYLSASDFPSANAVEGYTITGWYIEIGGQVIEVDASTQFYYDMDVYADLEKNAEPVTVTFVADGTTLSTATIEKGASLASTDYPASDAVDGYTITGWYMTVGETEIAIEEDTIFNTSMTVYAYLEADTEEHTHTYGDPVFTWAEDYSSLTATFTCTDPDCGDVQTVTVTSEAGGVTSSVVTAATATTAGEMKYTATFTFNGETYTTTTTAAIPATGDASDEDTDTDASDEDTDTESSDTTTTTGDDSNSSSSSSSSSDTSSTSSVKTGVEDNVLFYLLAALAAMGIVVVAADRRQKNC